MMKKQILREFSWEKQSWNLLCVCVEVSQVMIYACDWAQVCLCDCVDTAVAPNLFGLWPIREVKSKDWRKKIVINCIAGICVFWVYLLKVGNHWCVQWAHTVWKWHDNNDDTVTRSGKQHRHMRCKVICSTLWGTRFSRLWSWTERKDTFLTECDPDLIC